MAAAAEKSPCDEKGCFCEAELKLLCEFLFGMWENRHVLFPLSLGHSESASDVGTRFDHVLKPGGEVHVRGAVRI